MANIPPGVDVFESSQLSLYAATYATFSLAAIAVLLRFGSHWLTKTRQHWDDWLIVGALAVSFLLLIDMCFWIPSGFGRHYELFGPAIFPLFFRYLLIADVTYALSMVLVKFSMLLTYWRTIDRPSLKQPMVLLGMFMLCWLVAAIITAALQCSPSDEECGIDSRGFPLGIWVPNMATNIIVLVLPMKYIDRTYMTKFQRTLLTGVFGVGSLVCLVSVIRLISLLAQDGGDMDFTWNLVPFGVWTLAECNLAIVAACLHTFKPIWLFVRSDADDFKSGRPQMAWMEKEPDTATTAVDPTSPFRDDDLESGRTSQDSLMPKGKSFD